MIKVTEIRKSFGEDEVLKGVSTTFEKGKTNLVIGRSGSGKTVMLKCMVGLFKPNLGEILFEDKAISKMDSEAHRVLREETGMLFQGGALFDSMNIEENIMFPLRMFSNKEKPEMLLRVNEVLERVDLKNINKKFPSEISGGMKKRVSIARAIVNNPKYLFCDEPNSGLDPKTATLIDQLIQEITRENNITTVVVTHDMNSVMEIGENIVFLKDGKLVWQGSNIEIFKTDNKDVTDLKFEEGQSPSQFFGILAFPDFKPRIEYVENESTAELVGFSTGDTIISINQESISSMYQATTALNTYGQQLAVSIERDGKSFSISLPSKQEGTSYGLRLGPEPNSLSTSVVFGFNQTIFWIKNTFKFLFKTLNGTMGFENLSGPV